jgi:Leucine-rich repeat (LRR) protein
VLALLEGKRPDTIKSLDFSKNMLGKKGLVTVLAFIQMLPSMETLNLSDNYLDNDSVVLLCDELESYPHLRMLDISKNPISRPAAVRLARFVVKSPSLRSLHMHDTLVSSASVEKMRAVLEAKCLGEEAWAVQMASSGDAREPHAPAANRTTSCAPGRGAHNASPRNTDAAPFAPKLNVAAVLSDDEEEYHPPAAMIALVAPPKLFSCLPSLFEVVHAKYELSPTVFATQRHHGLALLFLSSREFGRNSHRAPLSLAASAHRIFTPWCSSPASPHMLSAEVDDGETLAMALSQSFQCIHFLKDVKPGFFPAIDLFVNSMIEQLLERRAPNPFPILSTLRPATEVDLRNGNRVALNILMFATFGDPLPLFDEIVFHHDPAEVKKALIQGLVEEAITIAEYSTRSAPPNNGTRIAIAGAPIELRLEDVSIPTVSSPTHDSNDSMRTIMSILETPVPVHALQAVVDAGREAPDRHDQAALEAVLESISKAYLPSENSY